MKKYTIVIEEMVVGEFEVFAEDAGDAMEIAADNYMRGEFVLEPGELVSKQMAIIVPEVETSEWIEF